MNALKQIAVSFLLLFITLGISLTTVLFDNHELKRELKALEEEVTALDLKCEQYHRECSQNADIYLNERWE